MKLFKKIKRVWYSFWYPTIKFENGYTYKLIIADSLEVLEIQHMLLTDFDTWDRASDVKCRFLTCWVWYRKPNNNSLNK